MDQKMPNLLSRSREDFGCVGEGGNLELRLGKKKKALRDIWVDQVGRKPLSRALWHHVILKALAVLPKERHWIPSTTSLQSGQSKVIRLEFDHYFLLNPHPNLLQNRCFWKFHFPLLPIPPHTQGQI